MEKVVVLITGIGLIGFIYWFFFGKKEETKKAEDGEINLLVEGGYKPSVLKLKKGEKTSLKILRKDANSCLEEIIIPEYKISKYLPVGQTVEVKINPDKKGEFEFRCGMNMHRGKIIVE